MICDVCGRHHGLFWKLVMWLVCSAACASTLPGKGRLVAIKARGE